jgi:hypothetical protein
MTDERETVIGDIGSNSNRSDKDNDENENEERMIGGEATLPNTLTHSLTLSQTPSLTIINFHIHYIYNLGIQNYSLDCDDRYNVGLCFVSIYFSLRTFYLNHLMIVVALV